MTVDLWSTAESVLADGHLSDDVLQTSPAPVAIGFSTSGAFGAIAFLHGGPPGERSELTCVIAQKSGKNWSTLTSGGISSNQSLEGDVVDDIVPLVRVRGAGDASEHSAGDVLEVAGVAGRCSTRLTSVSMHALGEILGSCTVDGRPFFVIPYVIIGSQCPTLSTD